MSKSVTLLDLLPQEVTLRGVYSQSMVYANGQKLDLKKSLVIKNHSPNGFSWGYTGSGASQFALALLLNYWVPQDALKYYQQLKFDFVSSLPQADFSANCDLRSIMTRIIAKNDALI